MQHRNLQILPLRCKIACLFGIDPNKYHIIVTLKIFLVKNKIVKMYILPSC